MNEEIWKSKRCETSFYQTDASTEIQTLHLPLKNLYRAVINTGLLNGLVYGQYHQSSCVLVPNN
jgi:hypothetical protein